MSFKLVADYKPTGDQPKAIQQLQDGFFHNSFQTLLGVTGSGKTYTVANVIEKLQIPTLVLAHNKTLAAQLYNEFKTFFPENKICYFVSYYDYYQPESYLPQTDTYIEKETQINEKLDQLRLEAAASLLSRPDTIVVSSVSCIYSLGSPHDFLASIVTYTVGQKILRKELLKNLVELLYERNDLQVSPGKFRVRGDTVDIIQGFGGDITRIEFLGDTIHSISVLDPVSCDLLSHTETFKLYPAKPFIAPEEKRKKAIMSIREELQEHLPKLGLLESHRLEQRTNYDLEMMETLGYCKGIENYSRHFDGRKSGEPPFCLLDFFKHNPFTKDFLLCIDESHVTIPQVRGMYFGDYSRKKNLIDYGFRLPSAFDNRPLKFHEFEKYLTHTICTSATPGSYEQEKSGEFIEQIVRPTGLVDPPIEVRPIQGCIDNLKKEILKVIKQKDRVLVTTITKKSSEELSEYLVQHDIKARYLHSEIETLERTSILKDLRLGTFDVLVGINLLREGLDLPEVGLVVILDADKEGFLRNSTSLIQTIGRAARNIHGRVIMYADVMTDSLKLAIEETDRRRSIQEEYNKTHNITPQSIKKAITEELSGIGKEISFKKDALLHEKIVQLEEEMGLCIEKLDFERAIVLRDALRELRGEKKISHIHPHTNKRISRRIKLR